MQVNLVNQFGIRKTPAVLYDKATAKFKQEVSVKDKHEMFKRIGMGLEDSEDATMFTRYDKSSD